MSKYNNDSGVGRNRRRSRKKTNTSKFSSRPAKSYRDDKSLADEISRDEHLSEAKQSDETASKMISSDETVSEKVVAHKTLSDAIASAKEDICEKNKNISASSTEDCATDFDTIDTSSTTTSTSPYAANISPNITSKKKPKKNIILASIQTVFGTAISCVGVICSILSMLISMLAVLIIVGLVAGLFIYAKIKPDIDACMATAYDKMASVKEGDFMQGSDTFVYDKDENMVGDLKSAHFEYVDISDISLNIQNLYISQEDKRFKEHVGIDLMAIARASLVYIRNGGRATQGGSTITQQVIKNMYLTQEKTLTRKITEILMAPQFELKFSKTKIMEYYCNTNYYGNRCYGVEAASQYYFGCHASEVTIAQAAILVGLSNNPSAYNPVSHPEASKTKRDEIINNAYKNELITQAQRDDALATEIAIVQKEFEQSLETYQSSYAVHCAAIELMKKDGFVFKYVYESEEEYEEYLERYDALYEEKYEQIRTGGYKIYTSLDSDIQAVAQTHLDETLERYSEVQENGKYAMQGAVVVTDNNTGYVVAIVGGRGTSDQFNRAFLSARQPGSSIKPLIDYGPAFDTGVFTPATTLIDYSFEDGPQNSGGGNNGEVAMRYALNRSLNTIAWQVLDTIGIEFGLSYLGNMKFMKLSPVDNSATAISIGGFTNGVRVVDMAKGFQTLANGGNYNDNTCIISIIDANGTDLMENVTTKITAVYEPDTAYILTDVLKGTFGGNGTAGGLSVTAKSTDENGRTKSYSMPCAGKTGTTNSSKDTWFCGYTKYYSAAVWVGYDTPRAMPGIYGATYAGKIWQKIMNDIHEGLEALDWDRPETVSSRDGDLCSSILDEKAKDYSDIQERLIKAQEDGLTAQKVAEELLAQSLAESIQASIEAESQSETASDSHDTTLPTTEIGPGINIGPSIDPTLSSEDIVSSGSHGPGNTNSIIDGSYLVPPSPTRSTSSSNRVGPGGIE